MREGVGNRRRHPVRRRWRLVQGFGRARGDGRHVGCSSCVRVWSCRGQGSMLPDGSGVVRWPSFSAASTNGLIVTMEKKGHGEELVSLAKRETNGAGIGLWTAVNCWLAITFVAFAGAVVDVFGVEHSAGARSRCCAWRLFDYAVATAVGVYYFGAHWPGVPEGRKKESGQGKRGGGRK
ncbi:hypothetical protein IWZ01DRAFT_507030 [Phyllosticta capitalensis]